MDRRQQFHKQSSTHQINGSGNAKALICEDDTAEALSSILKTSLPPLTQKGLEGGGKSKARGSWDDGPQEDMKSLQHPCETRWQTDLWLVRGAYHDGVPGVVGELPVQGVVVLRNPQDMLHCVCQGQARGVLLQVLRRCPLRLHHRRA